MKSIIFGLVLIAVVACDVSHLQGQGWSKDETGYKYPTPSIKFDAAPEVVEEEVVEEAEPEVVEEQAGCANGGSGPFCCINGADNEDCVLPAEPVVADEVKPVDLDYLPPVEPANIAKDTVTLDYLPPVAPLNTEYLPAAEALKLRKRQAQAKGIRHIPPQARRVYRRVYRRL
ncbi:hypothetical protein PVAND_008063 [Polypedilum vanderplanki]|uniref:Uncharacterized protein n=1 Tax=Polypedilum vanderplanki TaxID=319348 RepID=A0A9J6C8U0_POLVA|nr:hypothetical protein PVAND_008063 [Polypedilum vanderplanki]